MTSRWVLTAALLSGAAAAQDLGAYGRLAASLDEAARVRASSAPAALTQLDRAQAALEELKPTLRNRQIASGLEDSLQAARAALARTPAELQAQVQLARGLMRKALYDQTLAQPQNGEAQVRLLVREFGLTGAAAQATVQQAQAGGMERVAWQLQRAAVQKVSAALQATRAEQTTASYLNLARATSWFTVVQDAPGVTLKVAQFGAALQQLAGGDRAALGQSLATLRAGTQALAGTLGQAPAAVPAQPSPPAASPAAPVPDPVEPPVEPAAAGTGPGPAGADEAYGALGRALSAAGHADLGGARDQLLRAEQLLAAAPSSLRGAPGYGALMTDLSAAQTRVALRPAEVQALIAALGTLESAAQGQPVSVLDRVSGGAARGFSGWLRVAAFLLLALLAAVPLYLLNLAFGGRNTYWRAITAGLVLLLLPTLLEGAFGLLGAVGDAANVAGLRALLNLSVMQGAFMLPVWALSALGAIVLLAFGFRGLCEQFGLLGRREAKNATQDSSLDWDDDL